MGPPHLHLQLKPTRLRMPPNYDTHILPQRGTRPRPHRHHLLPLRSFCMTPSSSIGGVMSSPYALRCAYLPPHRALSRPLHVHTHASFPPTSVTYNGCYTHVCFSNTSEGSANVFAYTRMYTFSPLREGLQTLPCTHTCVSSRSEASAKAFASSHMPPPLPHREEPRKLPRTHTCIHRPHIARTHGSFHVHIGNDPGTYRNIRPAALHRKISQMIPRAHIFTLPPHIGRILGCFHVHTYAS